MDERTKIVIVDDSQTNRTILRELLRESFLVSEEESGEALLSKIDNGQFDADIILLDLLMSGKNGIEILKELQERRIIGEVGVIIISSENENAMMKQAFAQGAMDYIHRPFDAEIVIMRIENVMRILAREKDLRREINLVNQRQMDAITEMRADSVAAFHVNVTKDNFETGNSKFFDFRFEENKMTIRNMLDYSSKKIPDKEEKRLFLREFSRENILKSFQKGNTRLTRSHSYLGLDGEEIQVTTSLQLYQNPLSGDVEGMLYMYDMTQVYFEQQLQRRLLEKEYESVALINTKQQTIKIVYHQPVMPDHMKDALEGYVDYKKHCQRASKFFVIPQEQEIYLQKAEISQIQKRLEYGEIYFFTIRMLSPEGDIRIKRFSFFYMDSKKTTIISGSEDMTKVLEQDPLTGELNRQGFEHQVEHILGNKASDVQYAILFFNVKGFKAINEMFGSAYGDNILRGFPNLLREQGIEFELIARYEADHFVCLLRQDRLNYDRLLEVLHSRYTQDNRSVDIHGRCGVYLIDEKEKLSVSGMCDRAKLAKDYIQDEYLKPYAVFDEKMKHAYMSKVTTSIGLKQALENNEFHVFYQPVYSAKTHKIVSAEALVRWINPEEGMISPGLFIPALEESGQISQVDMLIVQKVHAFLEDRMARRQLIVPVSTNLSGMDFYDNSMMEKIKQELEEETPPVQFQRYEVTETSYASVAGNNRLALNALKELGAKILIDDFGSGYSSFSTLTDYNFDILKLDMGFVRKIGKGQKVEKIIESIIDMAHDMGVEVVAEGAETKEQVDFLTSMGCDYIQGYYFSKPVPQDEFARMLSAQQKEEETKSRRKRDKGAV